VDVARLFELGRNFTVFFVTAFFEFFLSDLLFTSRSKEGITILFPGLHVET